MSKSHNLKKSQDVSKRRNLIILNSHSVSKISNVSKTSKCLKMSKCHKLSKSRIASKNLVYLDKIIFSEKLQKWRRQTWSDPDPFGKWCQGKSFQQTFFVFKIICNVYTVKAKSGGLCRALQRSLCGGWLTTLSALDLLILIATSLAHLFSAFWTILNLQNYLKIILSNFKGVAQMTLKSPKLQQFWKS